MIAGNHKGTVSTVLRVEGDYVFVDGVNVKKRAKKGAGYQDTHHGIHLSNVAYAVDGKKSKIRIENVDGKRKRKVVASGAIID